jgi:putative membrane protein
MTTDGTKGNQGPRVTAQSDPDRISVELSSRRTGMSFQRTRMSADRTLMSVIRTSLSLIGFGFTIYQVFEKLLESNVLRSAGAPRHFGEALVIVGIGMLIVGIGYHISFMIGLRQERQMLKADGLIHAESQYPVSLTLIVALVLLAIGIFAILNMVYGVGPFQ